MPDDLNAIRRELADLRDKLAAVDKDGALARVDRQQLREGFDRIEHIVDGADNPAPLRTEVPRAHIRLDHAAAERRTMNDRLNQSRVAEWTKAALEILGFGDRAKRAWVLFAVAGVVMLAAGGYGLYSFLTDPDERAHDREMEVRRFEADQQARRDQFVIDSLKAANPGVQIVVPDAETIEAPDVEMDAGEVNITPGTRTPGARPPDVPSRPDTP